MSEQSSETPVLDLMELMTLRSLDASGLATAIRNSLYRPNEESRQHRERETSFAINWFFNGHKNKLTAETSYFHYINTDLVPTDEWRFRFQWDVSL